MHIVGPLECYAHRHRVSSLQMWASKQTHSGHISSAHMCPPLSQETSFTNNFKDKIMISRWWQQSRKPNPGPFGAWDPLQVHTLHAHEADRAHLFLPLSSFHASMGSPGFSWVTVPRKIYKRRLVGQTAALSCDSWSQGCNWYSLSSALLATHSRVPSSSTSTSVGVGWPRPSSFQGLNLWFP